MVSISIVHRASPGAFIGMCAEAGIDGLIVPDLPLEESGELRGLAAGAGLIMPMLIAPTTPAERAERLARASTGFVYMLARAGITGERAELRSTELRARVGALRRVTDLPIACGFGISTPAQVAEVLRITDAAIVGSALVRRLDDAAAGGGDPVRAAGDFLSELTAAGPGR